MASRLGDRGIDDDAVFLTIEAIAPRCPHCNRMCALPTVRKLALRLGVSASTAHTAMLRLVGRGAFDL